MYQTVADRQSQSGSLLSYHRTVHLLKTSENTLAVFFTDTNAVILHRKL